MKLERGGFELIRKIGIGDVQHVRHNLLGVAFMNNIGLIEQLKGAIKFANQQGMMLRAHVNTDRLTPGRELMVYELMRSNTQHQFEPWSHIDREQFDRICKHADFIVANAPPIVTQDNITEVEQGLNQLWLMGNGRFLGGNFAFKTYEEIELLHPELVHDNESFWNQWNA